MGIPTVVGVFLKGGRLLMERRSPGRKVYAGFLMCPAGHLEGNETFEEAFKREMAEELGIRINKVRYLFSIDDNDPFSSKDFTHNFVLVESYDGSIVRTKEADALLWLDYGQIKKEKLVLIVQRLVDRLHEAGML